MLHQVTREIEVKAPADRIYAIIADFHNGHRRILPPEYFVSLEVERGGVGAGTIIRFQLCVLGSVREFRAAVSEPEPGRVLVETNLDSGATTTFIITPLDGQNASRVAITSTFATGRGVAGWLERFLATLFLRRVYAKELRLLSAVAREQLKPAA